MRSDATGAFRAGSRLCTCFKPTTERAAFPGRNGLLVVEPPGGRGLIVVSADGAHPRKICTVAARCDGAQDPVWSPDGSEIAFATPDRNDFGALDPYVIYPDGSCLACSVPAPSEEFSFYSWDPNSGPGFLPDGRLAVSDRRRCTRPHRSWEP